MWLSKHNDICKFITTSSLLSNTIQGSVVLCSVRNCWTSAEDDHTGEGEIGGAHKGTPLQ